MGLSIKWDITYECNLNCAHCVNGDLLGKTKNEIDFEEITEIVMKLKQTDLSYIHMLGGEPTARKDFHKIVKLLNDEEINFGFNTNGLILTEELLEELTLSTYAKNIVFSIEGPFAEINDSIRGKNVFDVLVKNLKKVISLKKNHSNKNLIVTVNMVVSRVNHQYIDPMIDFCIDLGVDQIVLLQLIEKGNAKDSSFKLSFEDELNAIKVIANKYSLVKDKIKITPKFLLPSAKEYSEKVLKLDFPLAPAGCGAGTSFGSIDNEGHLFSCEQYKYELLKSSSIEELNLKNKDFYDIWKKPSYNDLFMMTEGEGYYSKISTCKDCEYLRKECFPCPIGKDFNVEEIRIETCEKLRRIIREVNKSENV